MENKVLNLNDLIKEHKHLNSDLLYQHTEQFILSVADICVVCVNINEDSELYSLTLKRIDVIAKTFDDIKFLLLNSFDESLLFQTTKSKVFSFIKEPEHVNWITRNKLIL